MRGRVDNQVSMMCLINPEDVVPDGHPLREIKTLADEALASVDEQLEANVRRVGTEHFSVDGNPIRTTTMEWATARQEVASNRRVNFRSKKRSNDTHESKTEPSMSMYERAKAQDAQERRGLG